MDAERAFKRIGDEDLTLDQLVEFALRHRDLMARQKSRTFREALSAHVVQLGGEGKSERHTKSASYFLRFGERHNMPGFYGDLGLTPKP